MSWWCPCRPSPRTRESSIPSSTNQEHQAQKVKMGENNEKLVEILEGLEEGENVALDARLRAAVEFKR